MRFSLLFFSLFICSLVPLAGIDIYVSPKGSEQLDGSFGHPCKLEQVLTISSSYLGKEEINIWLMDGIYYLEHLYFLSR